MKRSMLVSLVLAVSAACGSRATIPLETTPRTPAAVGTVAVEQGANNNTVGQLRVEHLAPPQKLRSDLSVYVAWVRPVGSDEWQNIGQLMVGESREGKLDIIVPHSQFEIAVSAEAEGTARAPSEFVVFNGQVDASGA